MLQKVLGKCTEVIVKQGSKIVIVGVGTALLGTASVISYNIGRKKGNKEGQKKASEIYEDKFRQLADMFD